MNTTLKRLDTFADQIDFSNGIMNPAIVGALQNINKVIRGSAEVISFAEGFADHVFNKKTVQTSVLFKDGVPKDKSSIVATVIDLLISFALFYIGKKKISKGQISEMGNSFDDHTVESWGRRGSSSPQRFAGASSDDATNDSAADTLIDVISKIVETKNYDAFDDAITGLQYQLINNFKL